VAADSNQIAAAWSAPRAVQCVADRAERDRHLAAIRVDERGIPIGGEQRRQPVAEACSGRQARRVGRQDPRVGRMVDGRHQRQPLERAVAVDALLLPTGELARIAIAECAIVRAPSRAVNSCTRAWTRSRDSGNSAKTDKKEPGLRPARTVEEERLVWSIVLVVVARADRAADFAGRKERRVHVRVGGTCAHRLDHFGETHRTGVDILR